MSNGKNSETTVSPGGQGPPGRPPKPGGRIPQVEVQRAYRGRLAAEETEEKY